MTTASTMPSTPRPGPGPVQLYTVEEACAMLAISRRTLGREMTRRRITPTRVGPGRRSLRFSAAELERYLSRNTRAR